MVKYSELHYTSAYSHVGCGAWCPSLDAHEPDAHTPALLRLHNTAVSGQKTAETLKESREGRRKGRRTGGERIATVITNKNHLSHLCNLFSFNMRSMLKRSGSLREAWEGRALG